MDSRLPIACMVSAGTGEEEPVLRKPMGLVFDRRTTPDLQTNPKMGQ